MTMKTVVNLKVGNDLVRSIRFDEPITEGGITIATFVINHYNDLDQIISSIRRGDGSMTRWLRHKIVMQLTKLSNRSSRYDFHFRQEGLGLRLMCVAIVGEHTYIPPWSTEEDLIQRSVSLVMGDIKY